MVGVGMGCRAKTGRLRVLSRRKMRFWYSASVAAYALLKRMAQNDDTTIVFHVCLRAGCCDIRNFSTLFDTHHSLTCGTHPTMH